MRGNIVRLLAAAFMCVSGVAQSAPIVYTVDIAGIGGDFGDLTGAITTDGTIGVLAVGDITSWNLTVGGISPTLVFDSAIPGSVVECPVGDCAAAGADALVFAGSSSLTFNTPPTTTPIAGCFFTLEFLPDGVQTFQTGPLGSGCPLGGGGTVARLEAPYTIGAVPEPGTFALLGLALAGLGFARKRSRDRQSTAV